MRDRRARGQRSWKGTKAHRAEPCSPRGGGRGVSIRLLRVWASGRVRRWGGLGASDMAAACCGDTWRVTCPTGGRWPMLSPKAVSGDYACPA
eukprot:812999-Prymnesium_polylepis.1